MKRWLITTSVDAWDLVPNAEYIERNDEMMKYLPEGYDDFSAAKTAMKKGAKLIDDIDGIYRNIYIDSLKNRKIIMDYISNHPEKLGRELMGVKS